MRFLANDSASMDCDKEGSPLLEKKQKLGRVNHSPAELGLFRAKPEQINILSC